MALPFSLKPNHTEDKLGQTPHVNRNQKHFHIGHFLFIHMTQSSFTNAYHLIFIFIIFIIVTGYLNKSNK